jgi:hypothetical protein
VKAPNWASADIAIRKSAENAMAQTSPPFAKMRGLGGRPGQKLTPRARNRGGRRPAGPKTSPAREISGDRRAARAPKPRGVGGAEPSLSPRPQTGRLFPRRGKTRWFDWEKRLQFCRTFRRRFWPLMPLKLLWVFFIKPNSGSNQGQNQNTFIFKILIIIMFKT